MRKKMSVIASMTIDNDDELKLDQKTWEKLKKIDLETFDEIIFSLFLKKGKNNFVKIFQRNFL